MDKLLNLIAQLQITDGYMLKELNEIESLSDKISESVKVYTKNCDEIQSICNEIKNLTAKESLLYSKITERENDFAEVLMDIEELQNEFHSLSKYEYFSDWTDADFFEKSELKMRLYGIQIEAQQFDPSTVQVKINFGSDKFVKINVDVIQNSYNLQMMQPRTKCYEDVRELLLESGDIAGFLCHSWKFFKS